MTYQTTFITTCDRSRISSISQNLEKVNRIMHREAELYEHHFKDHMDNNPKDPIDVICEEIERGGIPCRWQVMGKIQLIKDRMIARRTWMAHFENMLELLNDSAKESI